MSNVSYLKNDATWSGSVVSSLSRLVTFE